VLELFGELDIVTMPKFEVALDVLNSAKPHGVIFDLSGVEFISTASYAAIGRCSFEVDRVSVCPRTGIARRILRILGHDRLQFIATARSTADVDRIRQSLQGAETNSSTIDPCTRQRSPADWGPPRR